MLQDFSELEIPASGDVLKPGDAVVVAYYASSWSSKLTTYRYAQVTSVSPTKNIVTVGKMRFDGKTGYVYTSRNNERYAKRMLQATDALVSKIHRDQLVANLSNVIWALENTVVLEAVWATYNAGRAIEVDDEE